VVPGRTVAVDTETTGLSTWLGARPFMFTFANERGRTACEEFPVDPVTREVRYSAFPERVRALRKWLGDPSVRKVFFNAKFDVRMCEAAGMPVRGQIDDVMYMAKVCRSDEPSYGLKPLARKYGDFPTEDQDSLKKAIQSLHLKAKSLGWALADDANADYWLGQHAEEVLAARAKSAKNWDRTRPETREKRLGEAKAEAERVRGLCREYGTRDAERTIFLYLFYSALLDEDGLRPVYDAEMRLWPATYAMETRGVYVDLEEAARGRARAEAQRDEMYEELQRKAWRGFNPASPAQKIKLLVEREGLAPLSHTENGSPQVDKYFLEHYEDQSLTAKLIQDHSRAGRAVGMYFDKYLESSVDSVIHASFDQAGAKTLRFSCREPNFQNVPKRGPEGDVMLEVRRCLGPRPGHVWYAGDYAQIEARIFADKAEEETMLAAFRAGRDVYDELAAAVTDLTGVRLTRRDSKDIFLGKLYGLGKAKMLRKLSASGDTDEDGAAAVVGAFDETFYTVKAYQQEVIADVRRDGYVTNRYGQRVYVDRDAAYRGVNNIIQSEAARLMKRAMTRCHKYLREIGFGWLVMTIHDELVFEFPANRRPVRVLRRLKTIMEDSEGAFAVPTPVEFSKITGSWLTKEPCQWTASL
jgi:DNA polymerase I-like protein with 3'-5' exonuclease and polymerase domains